jgi:hypothetical protein
MPCFDTCDAQLYKAIDQCDELVVGCQDASIGRYHSCLNNCPLFETVYESQDKRDREA